MIKQEIIEIVEHLKENPSSESVDHILLFESIYSEYSNGIKELEPIVHFYLNGFDELPALREKESWNESRFIELRQDFVLAHSKLIDLLETVIIEIKNCRLLCPTDPFSN